MRAITNRDNRLFFDEADLCSLAQQYGTPLYVMSENIIRENCKKYKRSILDFYNGNGLPLFASKALSCIEMYKIVQSEGLGADVVSGGELYTAIKAGFDTGKIYFHGNNKTINEIEMAVSNNIGHIVVDNENELNDIESIAEKYNKKVNISFRIKPGIDAHTHNFIKTGQIDSKFGLALETGEALEVIKKALTLKNVNVIGLHCHIGSQIFEVNPFIEAAKTMIRFMVDIKNITGFTLKELNLGGGFGIKYTENDDPIDYYEYMRYVSETIKQECTNNNFPVPFILVEPGRSIVGEAGVTLYTIGNVKYIPNIRTYVSVDGGMCDNPRYILYKSSYTVINASKANIAPNTEVTVAGKCCESGDLIQENCNIATPEKGDILCVLSTGAYNYSMASNYNRNPRPAMIMIKDAKPRIVIKRESYEDLIKNDIQ